jgi:Ca2+-binding EF-hand superfamily protein
MQVFQKAYANEKGLINWFAFLGHMREPMGPIRREAVQEIFNKISEGQPEMSMEQLRIELIIQANTLLTRDMIVSKR